MQEEHLLKVAQTLVILGLFVLQLLSFFLPVEQDTYASYQEKQNFDEVALYGEVVQARVQSNQTQFSILVPQQVSVVVHRKYPIAVGTKVTVQGEKRNSYVVANKVTKDI